MTTENKIDVSQLSDAIMSVYSLYQELEVTDEITEENPAFDYICDIICGLYNACMDLMSLVVNHPDANSNLVREYKQIIADINYDESAYAPDDDLWDDDLIPFT